MFVVVEGVDGSGKSTLIEAIKKYFENDQEIKSYFKKIIYCQEPSKTGTKFCEKIRELVLCNEYEISNKTRALMFLASRSDHLEKIIEPELSNDKSLIICDRFYLSTLVYQGHENPRCAKFITRAQEFITELVPDITFFLDISKELFKQRHQEKILNETNNVLDNYSFDKFDEIVNSYRKMMVEQRKQTGKVVILNSSDDIEKLSEQVKRELINYRET